MFSSGAELHAASTAARAAKDARRMVETSARSHCEPRAVGQSSRYAQKCGKIGSTSRRMLDPRRATPREIAKALTKPSRIHAVCECSQMQVFGGGLQSLITRKRAPQVFFLPI